ncbi:MAG TPA: hypothetical protein VLT33_35795 [Labilithrix sp.]|nr:hypothetical protein [Labilithrix sp.]
MTLLSSSTLRFGNLGFLSTGLIAFALVALQGCAGATVTASSLKEPGAPVAGLGALRADPPARSTTVAREREAPARASNGHERAVRVYNVCRHCAP